jgi:hypothetical protein
MQVVLRIIDRPTIEGMCCLQFEIVRLTNKERFSFIIAPSQMSVFVAVIARLHPPLISE